MSAASPRWKVDDPRVIVVAGVAAWELVAIGTGKVPTVTSVAHRLRVHPVGRLGLWLVLGWLVEHIFGEGR